MLPVANFFARAVRRGLASLIPLLRIASAFTLSREHFFEDLSDTSDTVNKLAPGAHGTKKVMDASRRRNHTWIAPPPLSRPCEIFSWKAAREGGICRLGTPISMRCPDHPSRGGRLDQPYDHLDQGCLTMVARSWDVKK